jgi:hypothetical protein
VTAISAGDWVQISGDAALVAVTGLYGFFTWRLAWFARQANIVSATALRATTRVHLDSRLPLYMLTCEDFNWTPPDEPDGVEGEYTMTWRIDLLTHQPARLSLIPPPGKATVVTYDGDPIQAPIALAAQVGPSHTLACRILVGDTLADRGAFDLFLRITDYAESVVDSVTFTAAWRSPDVASMPPVATLARTYPGLDAS